MRWGVIWNRHIALYRLVVVSRPNVNLLSIDSTRLGSRIRITIPKSTFQIHFFNKKATMIQPFELTFRALPIHTTINTARPRSPLALTKEKNASLKNDHLNQPHHQLTSLRSAWSCCITPTSFVGVGGGGCWWIVIRWHYPPPPTPTTYQHPPPPPAPTPTAAFVIGVGGGWRWWE